MCRLVVPSSRPGHTPRHSFAVYPILLVLTPRLETPPQPYHEYSATGIPTDKAGLTVVQVHLQPSDSEAIKLIRHAVDLSG